MLKPNKGSNRRVSVADIIIKGDFRTLDKDAVVSLADSIKIVGLMHPPTVSIKTLKDGTEKIYLVAGQHRVAAAQKLGWKEMEVSVVKHVKAKNSLRRTVENLHHLPLTKIEEGEHYDQWIKSLVKEGGKISPLQPHDKGVKKAGRFFGKSAKTIRNRLKAAALSDEVKKVLKEARLDNNWPVIEEVASAAPEQQFAVAKSIIEERRNKQKQKPRLQVKGKKNKKPKPNKKPQVKSPPMAPVEHDDDDWSDNASDVSFEDLLSAWGDISEFQKVWHEASADDRQRFIDEVLSVEEHEEEESE